MSTPHERLKTARKSAGYATATDAAKALGMSRDTYLQHENGTREYDDDRAMQYARRFKTTPEHLKFGRGPARHEPMARIIGRVGANPDDSVLMTTAHDNWDMAPIPPGGSPDSVALEVDGGSMRGVADDGSLIYFEYQQTPPSADMLNQVVVCEIEGGRVLVKRLLKGSKKGVYDLQSLFGAMLEDQRIVWAAHISAIVPPYYARRIIRRAGEAA
jgi:DNA-binding XRE family transcriptional regulator